MLNLKVFFDSDLLCDVFSHFMSEYQLVKICKNTLSMVELIEIKISDMNKHLQKFHYTSLKRNLEKHFQMKRFLAILVVILVK